MGPKRLRSCLIVWAICLFAPPVISEEYSKEYLANPFAPIISESGGGDATDAYGGEQAQDAHPLQQHAVTSYTLMGIVDSPNLGIALVRSLNGEEFFVYEGDPLGNNEGVITAIFGGGLEVKEQEEFIILNVKNRSMSFEEEEES